MSLSIHQRIKTLIEDTSDLFINHPDSMNADFAEFASLAVAEFQAVLSQPTLTRGELTSLLRSGITRSRVEDPDNWPNFLAHYITAVANGNRVE